MKIAFVLNSSGLYGANRSLLGLIRYLTKQDHVCYVILPSHGDVEEELKKLNIEYSIQTYRPCVWYPGYVGVPFLINFINLPKIIKVIREWNVDLIHSNNTSHDIGMIASRILKKKHVWHVREIMEHNYNTKNIFPKMYKRLRAESEAVICVSKFIYDYHKETYPNNNMHMIYNPYDVVYYDIKRRDFASDEVVRILMAGNITSYKRQIDSVKAIHILIKKGVKNVRLLIVGDGEEQLINEIKNYIAENKLENYIELLGFTKEINKIREKTDIALCCSEDEALPRVVVEGMLGEMLIIGADSGGIAELIEHEKRGLLYEVKNHEALAEQINYAIHHKEKCREMILTAKKYAIDNFELHNSGKKVIKIYQEVLGKD